jgi:plastocyanin
VAAIGFLALSITGGMPAAAQGGTSVSIVDFAFQPGSLEVAAGTTVTWTNAGAAPHTVTSDSGAFDSGQLAPGASFSQTFDTPGTYTYHCEIHPNMTGTIVVRGGGNQQTPAPAASSNQTAKATRQVPATGVGAAARANLGADLMVLAALAAVVLGTAAAVNRRA